MEHQKPRPIINQSMREIAERLPPASPFGIAFDNMQDARAASSLPRARRAFVQIIATPAADPFEAILKAALLLRLAEKGACEGERDLYRTCIDDITKVGAKFAARAEAEHAVVPLRRPDRGGSR